MAMDLDSKDTAFWNLESNITASGIGLKGWHTITRGKHRDKMLTALEQRKTYLQMEMRADSRKKKFILSWEGLVEMLSVN